MAVSAARKSHELEVELGVESEVELVVEFEVEFEVELEVISHGAGGRACHSRSHGRMNRTTETSATFWCVALDCSQTVCQMFSSESVHNQTCKPTVGNGNTKTQLYLGT